MTKKRVSEVGGVRQIPSNSNYGVTREKRWNNSTFLSTNVY